MLYLISIHGWFWIGLLALFHWWFSPVSATQCLNYCFLVLELHIWWAKYFCSFFKISILLLAQEVSWHISESNNLFYWLSLSTSRLSLWPIFGIKSWIYCAVLTLGNAWVSQCWSPSYVCSYVWSWGGYMEHICCSHYMLEMETCRRLVTPKRNESLKTV